MKRLLLSTLLALKTASLSASGIAIIEQSVSGFKTGYAGAVTSLDEPSTIFFNPAGLSRVKGTQITIGGHFLSPEGKYIDQGSTLNGQKLTHINNPEFKDVAKTLHIPNLFVSHQLNDRTTFGLGVFSPFGLGIEHKKGWIGRYHGTKNDMLTVNINPSLAYKATPELTIGVGLSAQYEKAELGSDIDFGGLAASRSVGTSSTGKDDGSVKITGSGWAYGFNFGLLYELSDDTRWGFSYRSSLAAALKGDAVFTRSGSGEILKNRFGFFKDTTAETEITLPETFILGFYTKIEPEIAIMFDAQYTRWNRFKELRVQFGNAVQPDEVIHLNWKNKMRYALGFHYYPTDSLTIGIGGGVDYSPVNDENRSPRIPDADRKFWTAGASYDVLDWMTLDAGFGRMYFKTPRLNIRDVNKGNVNGKFTSSLFMANFGLRFKF